MARKLQVDYASANHHGAEDRLPAFVQESVKGKNELCIFRILGTLLA